MEKNNLTLKDKNIFITGGTGDLGRALVLGAAKLGANVAFTYSSNEEGRDNLLNELAPFQVKTCPIKMDIRSALSVTDSTRLLFSTFSSIDALINNIGVSQFIPLALMEAEDWDKTLDVNLRGAYLVTRAILPSMIKSKRGAILNIGSLAGIRILAAPVDYCASKAGLKGFTESLAKEVGRYNIRVNCIAPGILEGGVARGIPQNRIDDFVDQLALHRLGTLEEVSTMSLFLISDLNSYMSGHTVVMDGGL